MEPEPTQDRNPLHGITLERMLNELVEHVGWERMGRRVKIACFTSEPSISSSLKFLRRTPWARAKVEAMYLQSKARTKPSNPALTLLVAAGTLAGTLLGALAAVPTAAVAQDAGARRVPVEETSLRVLRFSPSVNDTPSSVIVITFDRAVSGAPELEIDPREVVSLAPAIAGRFEWSAPTTFRFIPHEPITPGTTVAVSIDTAALVSRGQRHGVRYELPLRFAGARPLAMMVGEHLANTDWAAGPFPVFRVLYSTVVDLDSVAQHSRLVFPRGCGDTISLKPLRQRLVQKGEGNPIERAGGLQRDTTYDRFRRVVEMEPTDSLAPNCLGLWHVASFDPSRPADAWHYGVRTAPPFVIKALLPCLVESYNRSRECESDGVSLIFSADVSIEEFTQHVHFSPTLPPLKVTQSAAARAQGAPVPARTIFQIVERLIPGQTYTVTIDPEFRDAFGRSLDGASTITVKAQNGQRRH